MSLLIFIHRLLGLGTGHSSVMGRAHLLVPMLVIMMTWLMKLLLMRSFLMKEMEMTQWRIEESRS
jgi:hypothetical protein